MSRTPEELLALLDQAEQGASGPPVEKWNPPLSGDMDMRIAADGTWYHEGDPIRRHGLVKLFSSILRLDGDDYVLVTPVEKWRIKVDDLPFVAISVERTEHEGQSVLLFTTNVDEPVIAGAEHPLRVLNGNNDEPRPQLHVRRNLHARVARPVFYELVEWGEAISSNGRNELVIASAGEQFSLGVF